MTRSESAPRRRTLEFSVGLAIGILMLGVGWVLAGRSETPDASPPVEASVPPANPHAAVPSHAGVELDGERREKIERWRRAVETGSSPHAQRRLALALLEAGQFYEAFAESESILASAPDDIDGLYVQAAVRVRMGQSKRALPLLERVLSQRADHAPALVAKGRALQKAGHLDLAVASWQRALAAVGGENDEIERMIQTAELGRMLMPGDS